MRYLLIALFVVIILGIIIALVWIMMKRQKNNKTTAQSELVTQSNLTPRENNSEIITIPVEEINSNSLPSNADLIEIKDKKILAQIDNLAPGLFQVGNAANNAVKAAESSGETLFRAILPAGNTLADSKEIKGAVRGFSRGNRAINHNANFMPVNEDKGAQIATNTASAAMGVAALVVGQYYMSQINGKLEQIDNEISKIKEFQNNEYQSKIIALISQVKEITVYQDAILENQENRMEKVALLDNLSGVCSQLVEQANTSISKLIERDIDNYETYEANVSEIQYWRTLQEILMEVLYQISDLKYTLSMGSISKEQSASMCLDCENHINKLQNKLTKWHEGNIKQWHIDMSEIRRKRIGLDGAVHYIPGKFNDDFNYRDIGEHMANMINNQIVGQEVVDDNSDLYAKDVQLIGKDDKIYYLLEESS